MDQMDSPRREPGQAQEPFSPTTPTPARISLATSTPGEPSLTPPPTSRAKRTVDRTPLPALNLFSPTKPALSQMAPIVPSPAIKLSPEKIDNMSAEELRSMVVQLASEVHDAKTAAAHYKLQHQMSQMESGEAVERMAVEMEMAKREIEVLQQAENQPRNQQSQAALAAQEADPNFRLVHVDIFAATMDDLKDLKVRKVHLERELLYSRQVLEQQESEIASLNDKVALMRDRMIESRERLARYRRMSVDTTPKTTRTTPFQTPVRDRFVQIEPSSSQQHSQPGFAALLQATDIVSQGGRTPRRHARNTHSLSSLPATPQRVVQQAGGQPLYTPQPGRQIHVEVPMTAPLPRIRSSRDFTPTRPSHKRSYDSDGTVSAADDSEAETEVAEGDVGDKRASGLARDMLGSPTAKRAKSAHNLKGLTQTRLFGQVTKSNVPRSEQVKEVAGVGGNDTGARMNIAGVSDRRPHENPV